MARKRGRPSASAKTPAGKKRKKTPSVKQFAALFWIVFFVVIFFLFVINWGKIQKTISNSQILDRLFNRETQGQETGQTDNGSELTAIVILPPETASMPQPFSVTAPDRQTQTAAQEQRPSSENMQTEPPAMRERNLYLARIDSDGNVQWIKAARRLPLTGSPMTDVLASLLAGPTREEQNNGLVSLIPQGTRILAASVQGSTARISFSEEFQYNTYGLEGCAAALRQVVWTVTEFPNVDDVQFLIDGRSVSYLGGSVPGEGIWIGSPLDRSF